MCPASVNGPRDSDKSSIYAATGTFAHDLAARCLLENTPPSDFLLFKGSVEGFDIECDQEMVDALDIYVDDCLIGLEDGDLTWVEMPLLAALSKLDSELGGTADFVRYRPSTKALRVVDFKYGSGRYVETDDNPQLKLYALGVLLQIGLPVNEIEAVIVQPRFEGAKPIRSWTFPVTEVLDFAADVQDAAARARDCPDVFVAGDHCGFCPRAKDCPALENMHHSLIAAEFGAVTKYDPAKLAAALVAIPLVKERIKAIEEFAYTEAQAGRFGEAHGFKLVDKRPVRKWKSEGDVIEWAQKAAVDPYAPRELLSPAQLEKRIGGKKKETAAVLAPFIEKISSGTALVPLSDDRAPAKRISVDDFDALPTAV